MGKTEIAKVLAQRWAGGSCACNATRVWTLRRPFMSGTMPVR